MGPVVKVPTSPSVVLRLDRVGTAWSVGSLSQIPSIQGLSAVSCSSPTNCVAVGERNTRKGLELPASTSFDGRRWTSAVDIPPFNPGAVIYDITCVSRSFCVAVGYQRDQAGTALTLVARFDGRRWTDMPTPNWATGNGSDADELNSISCSSDRDCVAVGDYYHNSVDSSLAEDFNGNSWRIVPTPSPGRKTTVLNSVSCDFMSCMAVGYYDSSHVLIVQERNHRWLSVANRSPGRDGGSLDSVTCLKNGSCIAVGAAVVGHLNEPLVEELRHGAWTLVSVPKVTGQFLTKVSCSVTSACVALGESTQVSTKSGTVRILTLVEVSTAGRWHAL
jgi:hypothetical protein